MSETPQDRIAELESQLAGVLPDWYAQDARIRGLRAELTALRERAERAEGELAKMRSELETAKHEASCRQ